MSHQRYHEGVVPTSGDPLLVMAVLARAHSAEDHIVYESPRGYAFAAGRAAEVVVNRDTVLVHHRHQESGERWTSSPYPALDRALSGLPVEDWRAYGTADFELAHAGGPLHDTLDDRPLLRLVVPKWEVVLRDGTATIRALDPRQFERIARLLARSAPEHTAGAVPVAVDEGVEDYGAAVDHVVRDIGDGVLQKVILSRTVEVPGEIDLVATYVEGRRHNTPARSFLLRLNGIEAAGFSPEIVVTVDAAGRVTTQPLAGTRALHRDPETNERVRAELLVDGKEISEHAVSVKVAHDELAALCAPGSPVISEFMRIKERGSVQHLGSEVQADLPEGRGPWDAFAALFPAVTASGIPKEVAYHHIREHEASPRGLYGGAVLEVGHDGTLDAALVLRAVYRAGGRTWLRAGAGIVAQSSAAREIEETSEKLRSVALHVVPAQPGATPVDRAEMRRDIAHQLGVQLSEVGDDDDLVELGLSSLAVMNLATRWSGDGTVLRYTDLLEHPTLAHWSSLVKR